MNKISWFDFSACPKHQRTSSSKMLAFNFCYWKLKLFSATKRAATRKTFKFIFHGKKRLTKLRTFKTTENTKHKVKWENWFFQLFLGFLLLYPLRTSTQNRHEWTSWKNMKQSSEYSASSSSTFPMFSAFNHVILLWTSKIHSICVYIFWFLLLWHKRQRKASRRRNV